MTKYNSENIDKGENLESTVLIVNYYINASNLDS
jgi:hypothetical protein